MRDPHDTGRRPFTAWLLAVALLPVAAACGERTTFHTGTLPSPAFPTQPQSTPTDFIFLADSSGVVLGQLTEGGWPSWSPDGRRIAFHRDERVRVIGADGSGELDLAEGQWPTWSPDGGRIAFFSADGISVVNADGSSARQLRSPALVALHDWGAGKPSWSPDGALVAFDEVAAYSDGAPARIYAMSADGKTQHILAGYDRYETEPSWSPDGSRVVYWSNEIGLAIVPRGGGVPLPLNKSQSASFSARPAWSPDGRSILFNGRSAVRSIMSIAPEGGSPRVLIEQGSDAAWSPDGKRIAFVRVHAR